MRIEDGVPPFFFLVQVLVDEHVRHQESVAAGKVSHYFQPCNSSVAF